MSHQHEVLDLDLSNLYTQDLVDLTRSSYPSKNKNRMDGWRWLLDTQYRILEMLL